MNIISDSLPTEYEGIQFNTNFREWMQIETVLLDKTLDVTERLAQALSMMFPVRPVDIEKALQHLVWFYRCGKEHAPKGGSGKKSASDVYSYDFDSEYIYGAFLEQYGIDLNEIPYLHWWKFKSMFKALKSDCEFVKIMGYRSVEINSKISKEQQDFYRKMKEVYEIPMSKSEQEKLDAIADILNGDGDLSSLTKF